MIRAEENYSRLTVVEEIVWRRGRERDSCARTHTRTHAPTPTHTHTHSPTPHPHTHTHWVGKSGEDARVSYTIQSNFPTVAINKSFVVSLFVIVCFLFLL